jgi:hypothetical protein
MVIIMPSDHSPGASFCPFGQTDFLLIFEIFSLHQSQTTDAQLSINNGGK